MTGQGSARASIYLGSRTRWLLAAFILLLWIGRDALPPFVVAGMLAYLLSRPVDLLAERARIRRSLAALIVFFIVLVLLGLSIVLLEPRLAAEIRSLGAEGPSIAENIVNRLTGGQAITVLGQQFTPSELAVRLDDALALELAGRGGAVHVVTLAVELALNTLLALVVLAYLLIDGPRLATFVLRFVPEAQRDTVTQIGAEIHAVLGRYLRGQLALIALMAVVTFGGLEWLFHLRYALPIALASGVLEIIPLIGPLTAAALACAVGFTQGGALMVGGLALFYFVLRQLEDYLVMPRVVGEAVHVHPVLTIFAVLLGERVAGALGMLLAVPCAAAMNVILDYAYPPRAGGCRRSPQRATHRKGP